MCGETRDEGLARGEDKQTADSFFEDIPNLSIKLLRSSRRRLLSPSSAVFVRALLFIYMAFSSIQFYAQNSTLLRNKINEKTSSGT